MKALNQVLAFVFVFSAMGAWASAPSVSTSSVRVTEDQRNKTGDIDSQVSDIKLRVDSGKKRKLSSSVSLIYKAGTWDDPSAPSRPALGDQTRPEDQSIAGNLSFRYRLNTNESVLLAAGFFQQKPFHNLTAAEKSHGEDQQLDIFSPQIGYNNTFAAGSWELSSSVRAYYNTLDYKKQLGEVWAVGYSLSGLVRLSGTRARAGISGNLSYTDFNKEVGTLRGRQVDLQPLQNNYAVNLTPTLQYDFTDKFNLYTSLKMANYVHKRSAEGPYDFERESIEQTLGLGYALIRDFYISPYVIFELEDMRGDRTLVNLKASMNL